VGEGGWGGGGWRHLIKRGGLGLQWVSAIDTGTYVQNRGMGVVVCV